MELIKKLKQINQKFSFVGILKEIPKKVIIFF